MFKLPQDFQWMSPWSAISPDSADGIVDELRREMPVGHVLANCKLTAIGQSENYDDFLFATDSLAAPLAAVHLTWSVESDSVWPFTSAYQSLDEWKCRMTEEHQEFLQRLTDENDMVN